MAKYAQLADGRLLEFPDETPQDVMDKVVKRVVENPYSLYDTEALKKAAPAPSSLRDLSEAGALGMAGGIKAFTDLFGVDNAASKKMEELQKQAFRNMTPERQREMAIEDELSRRAEEEGTLASIKESARQVARSPAQGIMSGLFSSAPIIAATAVAPEVTIPGMITGLAGRAGAAGLAGRGLSKVIASSPAIAVGAGMGVGSQKGQDYQRVKEEMLARGASEEEAEAAAQKAAEYSLQNAARQAAAGVAGGAEGAIGIESLLGRAGRARAGVKAGPEAPTWGKAAVQSTVGEAIPEGVQSAVGGIGSNIALQQAGIDTDLFKGVAGDVTRDTLIGALTGTAVTPVQMRQMRQEFARDQFEKQSEEQKKLLEELQKKQAEIAKTKEQLGTKEGLALPAPVPKVEDQDPLQNPLGNISRNELHPDVLFYINQYRAKNGMPLLTSYSIEDIKDAMTNENPEGEAGALSSIVAAKSGYKPDVNYSPEDVLNAAIDKVDTDTQGFRDFLRRTTGSEDLNTMSQPQLFAAFNALESLPTGEGKIILPEGSNASRYTETQMVQGLDAIAAELGKIQALTPEQTVAKVKEATGLKNDRDAASLLKQLVKDNNLDVDADGNFIAPTNIDNLPAGYTLEKGTFKQGEQQMYGAVRDGKPVEGVDTYNNQQDAQNKVDNLNKVRENEAKNLAKRIEKIQEEIAASQQKLDAMEAAGEGGTDAYKQAKAQNDAFVDQKNQEASDLQARQLLYQTPITVGPVGLKQLKRTGFTLFKDGVPVSTHPTADAAVDSLVGTLPEEEVKALADNKTPGMRTIARKARQRLEGKERIAEREAEEAAIPEEEKVARAEEKQKVQEFAEKLSAILTKFGLGDVKLEIIKGMEDEGSYVANLIKISLDQNIDDAIGVLRHESIHALKALGFFSPQQLAALERMAKEKWINQYLKGVSHKDDMTRYDAYKQQFEQEAKDKGLAGADAEAYVNDSLVEEAIADAFRAFGNKPPPGMLAAIINKIKQFFDRLKRALGSAGYETAEDIFGKIERGELKPEFGAAEGGGKKPSLANAWKATPAEVKQAETYEEKNGILPYISEGRLDLPTQIEKKSIKTADKYGLYQFDPVLNIPLNKDGTVTVYYHTTREEAKKINASKVIPSNGKARIYLTNESNGGPIVNNRGNFDQTLDGSTVLLNIDPSVLQVDQSYDNGRIDFFVPMAQGEYFNRKMRMASIQKGRKEAIVPTFSYKEHEDRITAAIAEYNGLDSKAKKARLKQARSILKTEHNVGTLLTENGKLEKTRLGEFEIEGYDGKSIASMGLGMASAQQISDKVSTCNRSAICEGLCLGETSGGNFLYGGAAAEDVGDIQKSAFRAAARMFQYLKTEALIVHPEEFAIALQAEIDSLKRWSNKNDYDPAIRLNVTSDFKPSMFSGLIDANRDVMFYDYTKLNGDPIAPNHHLTYSSTGFGQVINGEPVFFKNKAGQYDHNWGAVRARLDEGYGVAMAFSSKSALPKFLRDEETGKTYQIWDGDLYDARFLDPKAEDGVTGQIVGLRNKAATLKEKTAAAETGGFFIDYDPKRDGDTIVVPDQSQFKGKKVVPIATQPVEKKSLRAPEWVPQNIWDLHEKSLAADAEASGEIARPKGISPGAAKRNQTMAFRRLNNAVMEFVGDDENKANDLMVRMNEESSRREGETEKKSLRAPDTKEFKDWFSDSKAVDKEGRPMVMYHGTARDIKVFKPKQAGAIFVTPDPEVGSIYSADSLKWVSENAKDELTEEQQAKAIADALAAAKEDFSYLSDPAERKQPDYKKLVAKRDSILKQIEKNSFGKKPLSEEALPYLANAVKEYLPVGENVMPVFVRALNPFDYENKKHLDMVISQIVMPSGQVSEKSKQEARELGVPTEYPEAKINALKSHLARGLYQKIESEEVQRAIRSLGFDSFYVKEHGAKNLGVYSPAQLKSATGNEGTYDINNPDIRKSLRPKIDVDTQERINNTIGKRDESTWLERLMNAIAPYGAAGFRQAYINRYETIGRKERLIAKMKGLPQILADVSAEKAALFSDYAAGVAASAFGVHDGVGGIPVYRKGMTVVYNDNGKIKGPIAIFSPLAKFADPEVFRDWQFWVSAQRGARLDAEGREHLFTQTDLDHARRIEAKYPKGLFESVRKDWDTYNRGLVEYMVQTGVINKAMGDAWMKHGDYFPFYRQQMDSEAKGPKIFSAISGVKPPKELKGGTDTVGDFFENVIRNTQSAIEAGMKNVAAERAIQNELFLGDAEESFDVKGQPARPSGSQLNVVSVLRDGKPHYYRCKDILFVEAMKGLNMAEIPGLQLFAAPANLLRAFVTKTPDFILANLLRDSMSAWVTSGANITPVIDSAKGFTAALGGKDKDIQTLLNAGLIGGYEFTGKAQESGKDLAKQLRKRAGVKSTKEKVFTPVTSLWEALEKGSTASDAATRVAVYKETLAKTGNEAEALARAMEIMNFQRKGSSALIRILTAVTPFLNARIQGLDVLYRAGIKPFTKTEDKTAYEQAIAKAFIKRGLSLMALSCLYYAMSHDDEDYKAQEEETRDNNWLIPSLGVKIPIPFEVGVIFKVMPERIMAYMMGNDTGEQLVESAKRNVMSTFGIQLPQAILPVVEVATNYSFFTGRPIIGQGLEDVDKEFQVAPGTSKFAEFLGQITSFKTATGKSVGLSPIEIDHLIKGYTGTMGTYAVDAMDAIIDLNSDIPKPSKRFEQMPFIRRFALDPDARGNVTAYYELKNAVDQAVRTSNLLERTGKVEDMAEYKAENMPLLASKDYVNQLYKQLKNFNDMKRRVRSSGMDADSKRDTILSIEQSESALVSQIRDYRKMLSQ